LASNKECFAMADITVTKANVSLLNNGPTYRAAVGAAVTAGQVVYIDGSNGAKPADGSAAETAKVAGVVIAPKDLVSGETADIAGPGCIVGGFSGMTPGDLLYLSDTAGALADAPGTKSKPCARVITATEILWTLEGVDPA
jgi:hypothetical protein